MVLPIRISPSAARELDGAPSARAVVMTASLSAPLATLPSQRLPAGGTSSNLCQPRAMAIRITISSCYAVLLVQPPLLASCECYCEFNGLMGLKTCPNICIPPRTPDLAKSRLLQTLLG